MSGNKTREKGELYGGIVWLISAFALLAYGFMALYNQSIPGIEELVGYFASAEGWHVLVAAFLTIVIEGLYIIGNFFPGSSLAALLAVLSQAGGTGMFLATICTIFVGWCVAGAVNIYGASLYRTRVLRTTHDLEMEVRGRPWATWFPPFRANYEVAQVAEGGEPFRVFRSSVWVKLRVSLVMLVITYLLPHVLDVQKIENRDGFITLLIVALICAVVGGRKLYHYRTSSIVPTTD